MEIRNKKRNGREKKEKGRRLRAIETRVSLHHVPCFFFFWSPLLVYSATLLLAKQVAPLSPASCCSAVILSKCNIFRFFMGMSGSTKSKNILGAVAGCFQQQLKMDVFPAISH